MILELRFSNSRIEALVTYAQPLTGWVFVNYGSQSHCNEESGCLFRQASPGVGPRSGRIAVHAASGDRNRGPGATAPSRAIAKGGG